MKQKLVTLNDDAYRIAIGMKNFSAFVRRATLATEEGGLELVEATQVPSAQMIAILLARNQKKNGFDCPTNQVLMMLMSHFKD
tara:strand:- start:118 stop:366 length:249 start_codon:yes stop_codon:yes gene_type:complete